MSFIRWMLLFALAFAFVLLAASNWTMVAFVLPDGSLRPVPLPMLLGAAFVAGVIPTWAWLSFLRPLAGNRAPRRPKAERTEIAPSPARPGL